MRIRSTLRVPWLRMPLCVVPLLVSSWYTTLPPRSVLFVAVADYLYR